MPQYSTNLNLSTLPEFNQSDDPAIFSELLRIRNALKILQGALDIYTGALSTDAADMSSVSISDSVRVGNIARVYIEATEIIAFGALANIYDSGGMKARNANATATGKLCRAFCSTADGATAGNFAEFTLLGALPISGGVSGQDYYMSTTSGLLQTTAPAVVGNVVQRVAFGLNADFVWFNPSLQWSVV